MRAVACSRSSWKGLLLLSGLVLHEAWREHGDVDAVRRQIDAQALHHGGERRLGGRIGGGARAGRARRQGCWSRRCGPGRAPACRAAPPRCSWRRRPRSDARICSISAARKRSTSVLLPPPALAISRSIGPKRASAAWTAAATCARSVTSQASASAWPPAASISAASVSSRALRRATSARGSPARRRARLRPMPDDAPVSRVTVKDQGSGGSAADARPHAASRRSSVGSSNIVSARWTDFSQASMLRLASL